MTAINFINLKLNNVNFRKKNPEKVLVGSRNNYVNLFDLMYICIWYNALPGVKVDGAFPRIHRLPPTL